MRRAALAALIIILPLSLGLRALRPDVRLIDSRRLVGDAMARLASDGWSARLSRNHVVGWLISGSRDDCRIMVHFPAPFGEGDEKFRALAKSVGQVTYHHGRSVSREFPRLVPVLAWHVQRYAQGFGVAVPTAPLIAVARSPSCGHRAPDLSGLRQFLQARQPAD
jgi:hypothetical protein